ncbi:MAG: flagellar biosynthetic protein FliO [Oscillospiraceae bacterium]|nr:flagellar biosynthetic protein FliO [Oscillospiraceae bacterium]
MEPGQVVVFIIGTIVILFGAYYVTYFIGTKASGQKIGTMRNRNISLHDRFAISRNASFCVVEIAGKVYVVGVTGNSMTLLDSLDAADFHELIKDSGGVPMTPWGNTPVGRYGNKLTKSLVAFIASRSGRDLPTEQNTTDTETADNNFSDRFREATEKDEATCTDTDTPGTDNAPDTASEDREEC